jgi:hypothetical protein
MAQWGLLECISRMTETAVTLAGKHYTILKCNDKTRLSCVSSEFPDEVLVRPCYLDIVSLIEPRTASVRRYLITGTPGTGKTVSIIVWLYLAMKGKLKLNVKHIIVDTATRCALISRAAGDTWTELNYPREYFTTHWFEDTNEFLYLYDARGDVRPLLLPCYCVVFSAPNLLNFRDFIKVDLMLRVVLYMPTWEWNEVVALHRVSTTLQECASLVDIKRLFCEWGGVPKQILAPYATGHNALLVAIQACDAADSIQLLERRTFYAYEAGDSREVRSLLMHFEVQEDGTYEHSLINFGSPFIRDGLIAALGKSCSDYYREFMTLHRVNEYVVALRSSIYQRLVMGKLRALSDTGCTGMPLLAFCMEAGKLNSSVVRIVIPQMSHPPREYTTLSDIAGAGRVYTPLQSRFRSFDALVAVAAQPPLPPLWLRTTVNKTHALDAAEAHDCLTHMDGVVAFCVPPDVFVWWHAHNSVQSFVTQGEAAAQNYEQLNARPQWVLCIPGDAYEEAVVRTRLV